VSDNLRVDLHAHTQASDGVWTARQLIEEVQREGIDLFAVTDHDTTASVPPAEEIARTEGLLFLRGVEINTTLGSAIIHVLGYDIDPTHPGLRQLLDRNLRLMQDTDYAILRVLEKDGFPVDWQAFEHYSYDRSRGGFPALNFCIDHGFCTDVSDFFGRLFKPPRRVPHPVYPHPQEAVEAVRSAGGLPVLAHPFGSIREAAGSNGAREILDQLRRAGIRGIECYTPYHSAGQTAAARAYCDDHNLLITGGSDTHGSFTVRRKLGRPQVTAADLRLGELLERARAPQRRT
jgi:hypothetical protein